MATLPDYEKLGVFYLGRARDGAVATSDLILYDSKDLVTHAVCVGMTGSGKTGLCIGLLEEAAIDGIPALIIDPKGDLGNLMLTFPGLTPQDFRPWINESDAQTKGVSADQFAAQQAEVWRKGLADWGQSPDRIQRLRDAAEVAIYTPGSNAGIPLSVMKSFDCPPFEVMDDGELLRDRISTTVSSILGLAGLPGDNPRSREHILLSTILQNAWGAGQNLDLPSIITAVQSPGFSRVGVLELEAFYPSKERFELAMALNNLLASPQFTAWSQGQALDIGKLLYTESGKPRLAIVSIAHLGDSERMFFVALILNQLLAWTRAQSGTTSLRALLYMDEIAGYVPPVANPPSKQALLTLMKQARAFGVGVVLATQNPVDIDYKGLSNAGTWFIGRLQTEQDKSRLLDGLEGAMSTASRSFDRGEMDRTLSGLGKRVFLMNNVHEDMPVVFETRWCLSYLRGPLTRGQIKQLMDPVKAGAGAAAQGCAAPAVAAAQPLPTTAAPVAAGAVARETAPSRSAAGLAGAGRPVLPPDVPQYFVPLRGRGQAGATVAYEPRVLGFTQVHFLDKKLNVDESVAVAVSAAFGSGPVPIDWDAGERVDLTDKDVEREPVDGAVFGPLPAEAGKARSYAEWGKKLADSLFRSQELTLLRSPSLEATSKPGETEKDLRVRLVQAAREDRDAFSEKLRAKYAGKISAVEDRIRRSQQALDVQKSQATQSKVNTALSIGAAILGGFLGRKTISAGNIGKAATAMRAGSRAYQESGDVGRAEENVQALQQQLADLQAQFQAEVDAYASRVDPATETFEKITVRPKKTDIRVDAVVLAWTPAWK
ncbi:MAG: hypothetical protein U0637_14725 [Phycisphaerales bacterium]